MNFIDVFQEMNRHWLQDLMDGKKHEYRISMREDGEWVEILSVQSKNWQDAVHQLPGISDFVKGNIHEDLSNTKIECLDPKVHIGPFYTLSVFSSDF